MRILYSFLLYLLTPYLWLRLHWKGRSSPAYKQDINQRFAWALPTNPAIDVWIHAVSLGEVRAVTPLVQALLKEGRSILLTTMTPTGFQQVQSTFADKVKHLYIPYDLPDAMRRFFKHTKPRVGVIMETEIWPNMIHYANRAQIPLFLINARLSEKSMKRYNKVAFFLKPFLQQFTAILAQSQMDASHFLHLGAPSSTVQVFGNIKFDFPFSTTEHHNVKTLKQQWGEDRVVFIAASTHNNEEAQILAHFQDLQSAIPGILLLFAPRHPERFQEVYQLSVKAGFSTGLRSAPASLSLTNAVVIIDSLGELNQFYSLSDYAFVGGSLVPVGGHNVLEPIAANIPVFSGPYYHNFKAIYADLQNAQAITLADNAKALIESIILLHQNESKKNHQVASATAVLTQNRGSLTRYLTTINSVLQVKA